MIKRILRIALMPFMSRFDFVKHEAEVTEFSKRDTDSHPTWAVEDAVI